ncbi:MAG: FtsX-like permease family protein [Pseudomonadales bacterium]|nr:FtsX-like permease family protein [Pseudomonadales bacterium]
MLRHYLVLLARNLMQIRNYSLFNIVGLSIGLAACLLILNYLYVESSYDRHHQANLYRVSTDFQFSDQDDQSATASPAVANGIKRDFPEVLDSTRIFKAPAVEKFLITVQDIAFFEEKVLFADPSFFNLLNYNFLAGNADSALDQPFSVVITDEIALKLFPGQSALGQSIEIESIWGTDLYSITGVIEKNAFRTHIDGDYYVSSMSGALGDRFFELQEWGGNNLFYTFVQLQAETDPEFLQQKLPEWLNTYAADRLAQLGFSKTLFLEAMPDLYLQSGLTTSLGPIGNATYYAMLGIVAALILFIACINFTNLATARALLRAKEIGMRKVVGAQQAELVQQFMLEAFVYTLVAVALAYGIAVLAAPILGATVGKSLSIGLFATAFDSGVLIGMVIVTTMLVGAYPAIMLARFKPIDILRGYSGNMFGAKKLRKALVVVQFAVSIALLQSILVVDEQMQFIENYDLGFDKINKLIIPHNSIGSKENIQIFKNALQQHPNISNVGNASTYPSALNLEDGLMNAPGRAQEESVVGYLSYVEPDYLDLMNFEFISGSNFEADSAASSIDKVIITESLASDIGYDSISAVGQSLLFDIPNGQQSFEIRGVVEDFNAVALYDQTNGQAFLWNAENFLTASYLVADIQTENFGELISFVEQNWTSLNPIEPFDFFLMNDAILED